MNPGQTTDTDRRDPATPSSLQRKIPIVFNIDVEPDGFFIDRDQKLPWTGYESSPPVVSELREQAARVTGRDVHFTWLFRLDSQIAETYGSPVWPLQQYSNLVEDSRTHGDEIGIHVHPYRWDDRSSGWIADYGNQQWVEHCLHMSWAAYRQSLGADCRTCSMGHHWMNNRTLRVMEELGLRYDLSVLSETNEDGFTPELGHFTGVCESYENVPRSPYRPSVADFRVPDADRNAGIWMLPLPTQVRGLRRNWRHTLGEAIRNKVIRRQPLTSKFLIRKGPANFRDSFDYLVSHAERPYFVFSLRTALFGLPQLLQSLRECFDYLLTHPQAHRFVLATPAEAVQILYRAPSDLPDEVGEPLGVTT